MVGVKVKISDPGGDFGDFGRDFEVEMVGEGEIHLQHNKFTDQIQQTIIKTHKTQEFFLAIFVGIFGLGRKTTKSS